MGGPDPPDAAVVEPGWDFFISYTAADRTWAEWVSWQLEDAGYRVLVQAWDFIPGSNWAVGMQQGVTKAARTIALLSEAYLKSVYGRAEWQAAQAADPLGFASRLIPIRIADCPRPGLLGQIVSFDLFDLPESAAAARLAEQVAILRAGRAKPATAPAFPARTSSARQPPPSAEPAFPGPAQANSTEPPSRYQPRPANPQPPPAPRPPTDRHDWSPPSPGRHARPPAGAPRSGSVRPVPWIILSVLALIGTVVWTTLARNSPPASPRSGPTTGTRVTTTHDTQSPSPTTAATDSSDRLIEQATGSSGGLTLIVTRVVEIECAGQKTNRVELTAKNETAKEMRLPLDYGDFADNDGNSSPASRFCTGTEWPERIPAHEYRRAAVIFERTFPARATVATLALTFMHVPGFGLASGDAITIKGVKLRSR